MRKISQQMMRAVAGLAFLSSGALAFAGCSNKEKFVPQDPARGPGDLVGLDKPLNNTFGGGASPDIQPRAVKGVPDWQSCDGACQAYCETQPFDNPVDEAMCPILWGAGLDTRPVDDEQACRRLYADLRGRFPSFDEIEKDCLGSPISNIVEQLIESEDFVFQNQRKWADRLRYNNVAVSLERIYDADIVVGKMYRGLLRYDHFVEVISAHPVLTRRFDDANDRAEALFDVFVGRPPYDNERADMSKLYALWSNGYFDHPEMGTRLPDAFVEHRCIGESGEVDETTAGACTSLNWGYNRVVLLPDHRAVDNQTWAENLTPEEWELLQTPGRIIGQWPIVWEHAVAEVLEQYLGYDVAKFSPSITQKLVEYVLQHGGDIRAAHYAVVTSQIYLQSTECAGTECDGQEDHPQWTYGPLRQATAELWIDSVGAMVSAPQGACDHRITEVDELLDDSPIGYEVVAASRWTLDTESSELRVDKDYSNLAQTLGGCPDNEVSGRFTAVGILSTATQEAFVSELCNPALVSGRGAQASAILPPDVSKSDVLSPELAEKITDFQVKKFFTRVPVPEEMSMAQRGATACSPSPCTAETFGRGLCYALLSSSEMLFY